MTALILSLLPEHNVYCEPFAGGAAVFWAKAPSKIEVLNDLNGELVNFYRIVKTQFPALQAEVQATLHSRKLHRWAKVVYRNPDMFSEVKRAWAVWVLSTQSMNSCFDGGWAADYKKNRTSATVQSKRRDFTPDIAHRLDRVQIDCRDAVEVIRMRDSPGTFFYCDPPYIGTDQGHYHGYSPADFDRLLAALAGIAGTFLLSSYRNNRLNEYIESAGWDSAEVAMVCYASVYKDGAEKKHKTEVLTANYPIRRNLASAQPTLGLEEES
jgi:DNA adenine methylase